MYDFVATYIYPLFKHSFTKISNMIVQNRGGRGGIKGHLNNGSKTSILVDLGFPIKSLEVELKSQILIVVSKLHQLNSDSAIFMYCLKYKF